MSESSQQLIEINANEASSEQLLSILQVQSNENNSESGVPIQLVAGSESIEGQEALLLQSSIEVNGERHVILQQAQDPNTGEVLVFLQGENGETIGLPPEAVNANILQMGEGGGQVYTLALPQDDDNTSSMVVVSDSSGATMVTSLSDTGVAIPDIIATGSISGSTINSLSIGSSDIPMQGTQASSTSPKTVQSLDTPLMAVQQDSDLAQSEGSKPVTFKNGSDNIQGDSAKLCPASLTEVKDSVHRTVSDSSNSDKNISQVKTSSSSLTSHSNLTSEAEKTNVSEPVTSTLEATVATNSLNEVTSINASDKDFSSIEVSKGTDPHSPMNYGSAVIQVQDAGSNASLESLANAMVSSNDNNFVIMTTNEEGGLSTEINLADIVNASGGSGQTIFLQTSEGLVACSATSTEDGSFHIVTDPSGSASSVITSQGAVADNQLVQGISTGQTLAYTLSSTTNGGIEFTPVTNLPSTKAASPTKSQPSRTRTPRQTKPRNVTAPISVGETLLLQTPKSVVTTSNPSISVSSSSSRKRPITSKSRSNVHVTPSSVASSPIIPVQPDAIHTPSTDYSHVSKSSNDVSSIDPSLLTEGVSEQSQLAASRRTYSKKSNIVWLNPAPSTTALSNNVSSSVSSVFPPTSSTTSPKNSLKTIESSAPDNIDASSNSSKTISKVPTTITVTSPVTTVTSPRQVKKLPEPSPIKTTSVEKVSTSPTRSSRLNKDSNQLSSAMSEKAGTRTDSQKSSSGEAPLFSPGKVSAVPTSSPSKATSPTKSVVTKPGSPKKPTLSPKASSPLKSQLPSRSDADLDHIGAGSSLSPKKNHSVANHEHESDSVSANSTKVATLSPTKKNTVSSDGKLDSKTSSQKEKTSTELNTKKVGKDLPDLPSKSANQAQGSSKISTSSSIPRAILSKTASLSSSKHLPESNGKTDSKVTTRRDLRDTESKIAKIADTNEKLSKNKDDAKAIKSQEAAVTTSEPNKGDALSTRSRRKSRLDIKEIDAKPEEEVLIKGEDLKEKVNPVTPRPRGRPKRKLDPVDSSIEPIEKSDSKKKVQTNVEISEENLGTEKLGENSNQLLAPSPVKKRIIASETKKEKEKTTATINDRTKGDDKTAHLSPPKSASTTKKLDGQKEEKEEKEQQVSDEKLGMKGLSSPSYEAATPKKRGRPRKYPLPDPSKSSPEKKVTESCNSETKVSEMSKTPLDVRKDASNKDMPKQISKSSANEVEISDHQESPTKRKRGRPRKHPLIPSDSKQQQDSNNQNSSVLSASKKKVCFDLEKSQEIIMSEDDYPLSPALSPSPEKSEKKRGRSRKQSHVITTPQSTVSLTPILKSQPRTTTIGGDRVVMSYGSSGDEESEEMERKKVFTSLQDMRSTKEFYDYSANGCSFHIRHQSSSLASFTPRGSCGPHTCQKCGYRTSRMNNLVFHHKEQCPVVRLHWQNEINRKARRGLDKPSSSIESSPTKKMRLEEYPYHIDDSQDDMDVETFTFDRHAMESSRKENDTMRLSPTLCTNVVSHSDGEDDIESDFKDSTKKKFGFGESDVVWTKWSDVHWPALVINLNEKENTVSLKMIDNPSNKKCLTVSIDNVLTFNEAERNKTFVREGKTLMGDPLVKAVQKAEDYSRKLILGDESGAARLFGSIDAQYDSTSEEEKTSDEKQDDLEFENHKDMSKSADTDTRFSGMDSDPNDDFLDYQSTETIAQLKERRKAQNAKLLECIKEGKVESHLLGVYQETIPCNRHKKFKEGSETEKSQLKHVAWFGPIDDEDQQDEIYDYCQQLFKNNFKPDASFDAVAYLFEVWVPEAIVKAISKIRMVNINEAETIFSKGVILSKSEKDELEKDLMKEAEQEMQRKKEIQEQSESHKSEITAVETSIE